MNPWIIALHVCLLFCFPLLNTVKAEEKSFYIEVYYDTFKMHVWYTNEYNSDLQFLGDYPVTLTWKNFKLPQKALITRVDLNPVWRPTKEVKKRWLKKYGTHLKDEYRPNEAKNAMGEFKWLLEFQREEGFYMGDNLTRVHEETNPSKIGKKDSSGCVRLLKKDGVYLSKLLYGHKDKVIVYTTSDNALKYYRK